MEVYEKYVRNKFWYDHYMRITKQHKTGISVLSNSKASTSPMIILYADDSSKYCRLLFCFRRLKRSKYMFFPLFSANGGTVNFLRCTASEGGHARKEQIELIVKCFNNICSYVLLDRILLCCNTKGISQSQLQIPNSSLDVSWNFKAVKLAVNW